MSKAEIQGQRHQNFDAKMFYFTGFLGISNDT
jgi:hypothetical protein